MPTCVNTFCSVLDRSGGLRVTLVSSLVKSKIAPTCLGSLQVRSNVADKVLDILSMILAILPINAGHSLRRPR